MVAMKSLLIASVLVLAVNCHYLHSSPQPNQGFGNATSGPFLPTGQPNGTLPPSSSEAPSGSPLFGGSTPVQRQKRQAYGNHHGTRSPPASIPTVFPTGASPANPSSRPVDFTEQPVFNNETSPSSEASPVVASSEAPRAKRNIHFPHHHKNCGGHSLPPFSSTLSSSAPADLSSTVSSASSQFPSSTVSSASSQFPSSESTTAVSTDGRKKRGSGYICRCDGDQATTAFPAAGK